MIKPIYGFVKNRVLRNFLQIELSSVEKEIVENSVIYKYKPAIKGGVLIGMFVVPAIVFLPNATLLSVLIPITMVTGTAWFAISLANVRKKFEQFGIELTMQMFRSFVASLFVLGLLTFFSLLTVVFLPIITWGNQYTVVQISAAILGVGAVFYLLWDVFAGALKYDINDAMLTGQSEVAEQYFKKSLSLLHSAAENLRMGKNLEVANYYLGLAFYEIFTFLYEVSKEETDLVFIKKALMLRKNPQMTQKKADDLSKELIRIFLKKCQNFQGHQAKSCYHIIQVELQFLENPENQKIVDTRLSIIFEEIRELIDIQGEGLFKKY
ncbi:MAG: hypothetical protein A2233_00920 [Candidatus Kerfeldbacteria bacterium RIFOXYA2_FULL_38_24]|uniref:Uncharacterized protein n=1 Tax=Candidatus Kerfeldbacteria bacterium RIFOXYB2_FULL_38_14 TaxID=1798547 RepID=A0A1G2BHG6_9BACT|nr:MAG: hypothetical protein A2233_00920 [Candidatus Kerfeldbacteria bacterium RIFOXYA2_FULL_38_24]OGY88116.1 MAG: hypothetical protein A2319_01650 [Candidatus Kerfeldbacteria bacterium RIFOXYB2_FULL_38_14]OGY88731.1 MAG: hypothetical protein A2458_03075 [Candidatus Kerfeldbacteria bacterium RIFOXYC2_FULL_38_9]